MAWSRPPPFPPEPAEDPLPPPLPLTPGVKMLPDATFARTSLACPCPPRLPWLAPDAPDELAVPAPEIHTQFTPNHKQRTL